MARNTKKRSNGEGTIYYEESRKRWVAEISWQDRLGETHKKRFTAQKQVAVKTKLNEFKRELLIRQGDVEKASVTFEEFSKLWIENTKKNRMKPTALLRKECTLRNQVSTVFLTNKSKRFSNTSGRILALCCTNADVVARSSRNPNKSIISLATEPPPMHRIAFIICSNGSFRFRAKSLFG